jgi:hypothetical protein
MIIIALSNFLLLMNKIAIGRVNSTDIFLSSLLVLEGKRMAPQNVCWD